MAPATAKKKKGPKKAVQETQGMLFLMERTGYTKAEIIALTTAFRKVAGSDDMIDVPEFRTIYCPVMKCTPQIADGIFKAADHTGDGFLELREFLSLCAVLQRGSALDKLKVIFEAWDADSSGQLSPEEVERMLNATITLEEEDAKACAVQRMTQRVFQRVDGADGTKKDGKLSFSEIQACFEKDGESRSLIQSFLGQNLPAVSDLIG